MYASMVSAKSFIDGAPHPTVPVIPILNFRLGRVASFRFHPINIPHIPNGLTSTWGTNFSLIIAHRCTIEIVFEIPPSSPHWISLVPLLPALFYLSYSLANRFLSTSISTAYACTAPLLSLDWPRRCVSLLNAFLLSFFDVLCLIGAMLHSHIVLLECVLLRRLPLCFLPARASTFFLQKPFSGQISLDFNLVLGYFVKFASVFCC